MATKTYNVEVIGPNLHNSEETFHVHAQGCSDIARDPKRHGYSQYRGQEMRMEVHSLTEVVDAVYDPGNFQCESGEYAFDFKVFPCVKGLPD